MKQRAVPQFLANCQCREFKFIQPADDAAADSFYELPAGFTLSKLKSVMTMSDTDLV